MMMTLSPQSTCGVKIGLCLPRRILATMLARRPTTSPLASISSHFFSTSDGLADTVVFMSAFMAFKTLYECETVIAARKSGVDGGLMIDHPPERSEEHTSELQSLMRTSYAVFCL